MTATSLNIDIGAGDAKMNKSQSTASPSRSSLSSRRYRLRTANYSTDGNSYENHSTISLTSLETGSCG